MHDKPENRIIDSVDKLEQLLLEDRKASEEPRAYEGIIILINEHRAEVDEILQRTKPTAWDILIELRREGDPEALPSGLNTLFSGEKRAFKKWTLEKHDKYDQ